MSSIRKKGQTLQGKLKRAERRVMVGWIRFAQKHRESQILPFALFALLFMDGFLVVIPSMICLVAAVMISPQRWILFAFIFALATAANNSATYVLGRVIPQETLFAFVDSVGLEPLWDSARVAIKHYGSYATLIGALFGLPTQLITMLIGIADTNTLRKGLEFTSSFASAILFAGLGHGIKAFVVSALTRYGWVKLEKKFVSENKDLVNP
jgi:membrane protein YqaA with SNARE-associated domain